jgi:hypothetical protein
MTLESDGGLALHDSSSDAPDSASPATIGNPGRAYAEVRPLLRTDPSHPPDTAIDHGSVRDLEVRAASVRGLSHRQAGVPRQDAYGFAVTDDQEWLVAVVADGVSAGSLSHEAASFVARRGPREVARRLDEGTQAHRLPWHEIFTGLAATILAEGVRSLRRTAAERYADEPPTEAEVAAAMATTATFLVCEARQYDDGRRRVHVAWMGDSPAWAVTPDGVWQNLSVVKGEGDEVGSSRVVALPKLPRDPAGLPCRSHEVDSQATLLLMTDGTGDPIAEARGEVAQQLATWWQRPPAALVFADQVGFGRRSYDDDRTVVAIWPAARPAEK